MGCEAVEGPGGGVMFLCGPGLGRKPRAAPAGPVRQVVEHAAPYRSEPRWRDVLECGHTLPSKAKTYPKTRRCPECQSSS